MTSLKFGERYSGHKIDRNGSYKKEKLDSREEKMRLRPRESSVPVPGHWMHGWGDKLYFVDSGSLIKLLRNEPREPHLTMGITRSDDLMSARLSGEEAVRKLWEFQSGRKGGSLIFQAIEVLMPEGNEVDEIHVFRDGRG